MTSELFNLAGGPLGGMLAKAPIDQPLRDIWFRSRPSATYSSAVDDLFMWIFWFSVIAFVILMYLMFYWTWKYRRSAVKKPILSTSHNTPLEIAWTVLPLIPLAYIFFKGFHGYADALIAPQNAMELRVEGKKWNWLVTYPNGEESPLFTTDDAKDGEPTNTLASTAVPIYPVPEDRPIKLRMSSRDVIHAFWIPDFRIKQDVMPNRYTSYWFQSEKLSGSEKLADGTPKADHWVFCAEYCGQSHSEMMAILRVVPEAYFNQLMIDWTGNKPPEVIGERVYKGQCASCHSVDGSKNTGPTWKNAYGTQVPLEDGSTALYDENYIRESILNPQAKIHKGFGPYSQMNSFQGQLSEKQIDGLIAYLKKLNPSAAPAATDSAPASAPAK
jgi:cytochrome c oxidase subunit 2